MPFIEDVDVELAGAGVGDLTGRSVSSAGDVNGDTFEDIIIGAPGFDGFGNDLGGAYILFGKATGFGAVDLSALAPADGFAIEGGVYGGRAGQSVSGAGDINGDGFDDLVVGAPEDYSGGIGAGAVFVVYGKASGFATVDLTALGTAGFSILGGENQGAGTHVTALGDINGDTIDDLMLAGSGSAGIQPTIIFGKAGDPADIDLATLAPADGLTLTGASGACDVSSAGDYNGDGIDDLLIGDPSADGGTGAAYLLFGKTGGFDPVNLAAIAASDGIRIDLPTTYQAARSVSSAGDINGDGFDDIIVGSTVVGYSAMAAGDVEAYVIFGNSSGTAAISPGAGFKLNFRPNVQLATGTDSVATVAGAGDVNGDGFEDLIVGSTELDAAFVLYGRESWASDSYEFGASHTPFPGSVLALYGQNYTSTGSAVSAADVNGDGFWDVLVGAEDGGPDVQGAAHIVLGAAPTTDVHRIGSIIGQTIRGGSGNDLLEGRGGGDVLIASDGNDRLEGGTGADDLYGGIGDDTYEVDDSGDEVLENPGQGADTVESSISFALGTNLENLTLTGTAAINGTGNSGANLIIGNGAANTLNGAGGADVMEGGDGDDVYLVLGGGATVSETSSTGGTDRVESYVSFTLGANFENLTLASTGTAANAAGNELDNIIVGNFQNNTLDGAAGADTMDGSGGDDTYIVDDVGDVTAETSNTGGYDGVQSSAFSHTLGANIEYLTLSGSAAIIGIGNAGANSILGNGENNFIDGGAGADTMSGGLGDDDYVVDHVDDVVIDPQEASSTFLDIDHVSSSVTYTLGDYVETLDLTGTAAINGTGNARQNVIVANSAANILEGLGESDVLDGGGGADIMRGGTGWDTYYVDDAGDQVSEAGGSGDDRVYSTVSFSLGADVERLDLQGTDAINGTGNALANGIRGNSGANRIDGGAGADAMEGGFGNDLYIVDDAGDVASETHAGGGTDEVQSSVGFSLGANVEYLSLTGLAAINGTGNALANILIGNAAANILNGAGGVDFMQGGDGDDTYVVDDNGDSVSETTAAGGIDAVETNLGFTLGDHVEYLTLFGTADVDGTGNALDNRLVGNAGANRLDGGAGQDYMEGGDGDDVYVVRQSGEFPNETSSAGGTDTVETFVSTGLGNNIENLTMAGTAAINGSGNALANIITGNAADNVVDGGAGADSLRGGGGNDIYLVDDAADAVVELAGAGTDEVESSVTYALAANLEILQLTGAGDANATGNVLANTLHGNAGANRLDGRGGADAMYGGQGDDLYIVDDSGDIASDADGTDTILSSASYTLTGQNIETLRLAGTAALSATGDYLANRIFGNGAANRIDGAGGADRLRGGGGDDTYLVDDAGDVVVEATGAGADTVESSVTFRLGGNLEALILTGTGAVNGAGNGAANSLTGNAAANLLNGAGGADAMSGGDGDDTYHVDDAGDTAAEAADDDGNDRVVASVDYALSSGIEDLQLTGGAMTGTGNDLANRLSGTGGDNQLDGGVGADVMLGGAGDDTYFVDDAGDRSFEAAASGSDRVESSVSTILGPNIETLILTGTASIDGTGNGIDNIIVGTIGANRLDGRGGADILIGDEGDDTYLVDDAADSVSESAGAGDDQVRSSVSWTLGSDLERLTLLGAAAIDATGNALANILLGNGAANRIDGAAGADRMAGLGGNDIYVVDSTGDTVVEGAAGGTDRVLSAVSLRLGANVEDLVLTGLGAIDGAGNALANSLVGNAAANLLDGGGGDDRMRGGAGDDVYRVDSAGDRVAEATGGGVDRVESLVDVRLGANVENLLLRGTASTAGTGNALANAITGSAGANRLDGAGGADRLEGRGGDDLYIVDDAADMVVESGGRGSDVVLAKVSYVLADGVSVETLRAFAPGSAGALDLTGNGSANRLLGNGGVNRLDGGGGADAMAGLGGNDLYLVDHEDDRVLEAAGGGADTVLTQVSYALTGAEVERLRAADLAGTAALALRGNGLDNAITGNAGANRLDGAGGADTMRGGAGDDVYVVDEAADDIAEAAGGGTDTVESRVDWALGAGFENLALTGTALAGTGNDAANLIEGNNAANRIDGGGGADRMAGGKGDDVYVVAQRGDVVLEAGGEGNDRVESMVSHSLGEEVETLVLVGAAARNGTGNALANRIEGNAAANRLDGGAGADLLIGGLGNDTYLVEGFDDEVREDAAGGLDTVLSSGSYELGVGLERLVLTGVATDGIGNAVGNAITGNDGINVLDGRAGNDRLDGRGGLDIMKGGAGNDTFIVDDDRDFVLERAGGGTDTVLSSASVTLDQQVENLVLTGADAIDGSGNAGANRIAGNRAANILSGAGGDDRIDGGGGADRLDGGEGRDQLTGGAGADSFAFSALLGIGEVDLLADFTAGEDGILLDRSIFADLADGALAEAAFRLGTAAADADDRILYDAASGRLFYDADGNGAAAAILFARLSPGTGLTHTDIAAFTSEAG